MKVIVSRAAEKEILSLEKKLAQRIADEIGLLISNPYPKGFKKLSGRKGFRIRIGDYRVIYQIDKKSKSILIVKVAHRREVYR